RRLGARKAVARANGVHETTVSRWHSGIVDSPISASMALHYRLAVADGVQAWELLTEELCVVTEAEMMGATTRGLLYREQQLEREITEEIFCELRALTAGTATENREMTAERSN